MDKTLPLKGIKVIELATVVAAPTAGRLLADFGAEVIKIETPDGGDVLRAVGEMHQMPAEEDNNPLFDVFNTGKRLISLNLKSDEGREVFFRLLSKADVFMTNTRMQSLKKMGLGYEELREQFPGLIYAHFSGFGLEGEDRDRPGFDSTAFWMRSGAVGDMVLPGGFPARPPYAFGDIATASYFLSGILMALIGRERTGRGTLLSTSLFASGIWMCAPYVINTQEKYGKQLPSDRYDPWSPFSDIYLCGDGVYITPISKKYSADRAMLAEVFGMRELVEDPELGTVSGMRASGKLAAVTKRLEEVILTKSSKEWAEIFRRYDIPYEILGHIKDVTTDGQARANGYVEDIAYRDGVTVMPVPPIKFSEYSRRAFERQRPIGADTDSIMNELGYSVERIRAMKEKRAVR